MGLRERKRDQTRRDLMYAALELFSERGYDAVTIDDIVERANVSPRTFFRYFKSKAHACFGFVERTFEELRESEDALATSVAQIRDYARRVAEDPGFYETQTRLTLEHPRVRLARLELLVAFDDLLTEKFLGETPKAGAVKARLAAYLVTHLITVVMEDWARSGAPRAGPDWEPALASTRDAVTFVLGRS